MREHVKDSLANDDPEILAPELERLLRDCARLRPLAKNGVLYTYGSSPDALFCVERGLVRLSVTSANGREAVISVMEPYTWFGELSLFIDAPRVHDARAIVDSDLLVVPAAAFHEIVDHRPEFLLEFMRLICTRYKWALERIDATILLPVHVRLARRLLAIQRAQCTTFPAGKDWVLRLSQEELGHMLGVSRQSVNKQLKEWEAQNFLRVEYGRITLLDREALTRLA